MKKIIETIKTWLWKKTEPFTTQDQINFDLERFQIKFCKNCGAPFHAEFITSCYCSTACRINFNNRKRKQKKLQKLQEKRMTDSLNGYEEV